MRIKKTYFANQLEVIFLPMGDNSNTLISWICHLGMQDEDSNKGISHLVEHLLCDNLNKSINNSTYSFSNKTNAFTTSSLTHYYTFTKTENEHELLNQAISNWMYFPPTLESLEKEKKNVLDELLNIFTNDSEKATLSLVFNQWNESHHLSNNILAEIDKFIFNITLKDIYAFIYEHYSLQNLTLLVSSSNNINDISCKLNFCLSNLLKNYNLYRAFFLTKKNKIKISKEKKGLPKKIAFDYEKNSFYLSFKIKNTNPEKYYILLLILHYFKNSDLVKFPNWVCDEMINCFSTGYTDQNLIIFKGKINAVENLKDKEEMYVELKRYITGYQLHIPNIFNHFVSSRKGRNITANLTDVVYWLNHNRIYNKKKETSQINLSLEKNEWEDLIIPMDVDQHLAIEDIENVFTSVFYPENSRFLLLP